MVSFAGPVIVTSEGGVAWPPQPVRVDASGRRRNRVVKSRRALRTEIQRVEISFGKMVLKAGLDEVMGYRGHFTPDACEESGVGIKKGNARGTIGARRAFSVEWNEVEVMAAC